VVTTAATLVVIIAQAAWTVGPMPDEAQVAIEAIAQYEPFLEMASEKLGLAEGEGLDKYADNFALSVMSRSGDGALLQLNAEFRASSMEEGERIFGAVVDSVDEMLTRDVYLPYVMERIDHGRERLAIAEAEYEDVRSEYEDAVLVGGAQFDGEIERVSERISALQSELLELRIEGDIAELEAERLSQYAANELEGLEARMKEVSQRLSEIPEARDEGVISEEEFASLKERYLRMYMELEDKQTELRERVSSREFDLIGLEARTVAYQRARDEMVEQRQNLRRRKLEFDRLAERMDEARLQGVMASKRLEDCEEMAMEARAPRLVQPPRVQAVSEEEWKASGGMSMVGGVGMRRSAVGGYGVAVPGAIPQGTSFRGGGGEDTEEPLPPIINLPAGTADVRGRSGVGSPRER